MEEIHEEDWNMEEDRSTGKLTRVVNLLYNLEDLVLVLFVTVAAVCIATVAVWVYSMIVVVVFRTYCVALVAKKAPPSATKKMKFVYSIVC